MALLATVGAPDFLSIGISAFLEADTRPTFVFDCLGYEGPGGRLPSQPAFINKAFRALTPRLPSFSSETWAAFRSWAVSSTDGPQGDVNVYEYAGHQWQRFNISRRWEVVTTSRPSLDSAPSVGANHVLKHEAPKSRPLASVLKGSSNSAVRAPSFDWTISPAPWGLSEHVKFVRNHDWASTSAGRMETWCPQLRTMLNTVMLDPNPACLYWGEDLVLFYNEAYTSIAGPKHPALLGQVASVGWADIWDEFSIVYGKVWNTGQPIQYHDAMFFLGVRPEETYVTFTISPVLGEDGAVAGCYQRIVRTTQQVLSHRRMSILLEVRHRTAAADTLKEYWQSLLAAMEPYAIDVPSAVLYSVDTDAAMSEYSSAGSSSSSTSPTGFWLEGTVGVPSTNWDRHFDSKSVIGGWLITAFRKAEAAGGYVDLDAPQELVKEQDKQRGFGAVCERATLHVLRPSNGAGIRGFLILGLNSRQAYDKEHKVFRQTLGWQIASSLASIVLFEDEIATHERRIKEAVTDKAMLSQEVLQRVRENEVLENRFFRIAQLSPVGIFVTSRNGELQYANDRWYNFAGISKTDRDEMPWMNSIWHEDRESVMIEWTKLVREGVPVHFEFRFRRSRRQSQESTTHDDTTVYEDSPFRWVLASSYPDILDDGTFLSVSGTLTDITQQKNAETNSEKKASEALEAKRQTERFLDMTSHEIRNPLNAILQCADSIMRSLKGLKGYASHLERVRESIESAETIVHCAEHQKTIVDDILTLSKLDSNLLQVTPVPVQPAKLTQHALKLFNTQAQAAKVELKLELDSSLAELNVDWVLLDPSRVLQILINLLTNAIKFTASEGFGTVKIGVKASLGEPQSEDGGVHYFPSQSSEAVSVTRRKSTADAGEQFYMSFFIEDTGRGLTPEEQTRLFNRFAQASPRTHVQYGGSGLGLYISRQLTELQGGKIGLSSQANSGSVFAFYLKVDRYNPPTESSTESVIENTNKMQIAPSVESNILFQDWLSAASVLIVEDNLVNQRVLRKQLSPLVKTTYVANNGVEALECIRGTRHWKGNSGSTSFLSVVLMDVEMPVMGGLDCVREVRRLEREGEIVEHLLVIAITANARQEQMDTAKEAGMDDVLTKPFKIKDLKDLLEQTFRSLHLASLSSPNGATK